MKSTMTYLDSIVSATSVETLWTLHTAHMALFGFDRLIYGSTRYNSLHSLGDPQDWVLLTNHTPDYTNAFIGDGHLFNAPMVRWALENCGACSWRLLEDLTLAGNLTDSQRNVIGFNQNMNVIAGYTISFKSVSERVKAAIGLTAKAGLTQDDVDDIWTRHGDDILVANNVMHLKLQTLPHSGARRLTKRQREVLQWVGDGKTTQDIAILLNLTPATIEKHLRLAREALGVETTAQAILKSAFYNQMFVLDI